MKIKSNRWFEEINNIKRTKKEKKMRKGILLTAILVTSVVVMASGPYLSIGSKSVKAGQDLAVGVTLRGGGEPVAALTADVAYDASALTPEGVETPVPGKVVQGAVVSPGVYRFTLYGGREPVPEGTVVVLRFTTAKDRCGEYGVTFPTAPSASTADAAPVSMEGQSGTITLIKCKRTAAA
jgi:hypothetical protein